MTARLFEPLTLDALILENRILVAPMCQYSARDGEATDWHMMHLGQLAMSGAGLLTLEATAVSPEARITAWDLGLYNDGCERAFGRVLDAVREYAPCRLHPDRPCRAQGVQRGALGRRPADPAGARLRLAHGGALGRSARGRRGAAHALDAAGLKRVRDQFVATAKRAVRLGIEAVELHGAHGYLLHQFLSPIANKRTDAYGGSLENRMRFPLEVYDAVRDVFPAEKPVWLRVSATDWVEDGWDLDETVALAKALKRPALPRSMSRRAASRPRRRSSSGRATRCPMPSGSRQRPGSRPSRSG